MYRIIAAFVIFVFPVSISKIIVRRFGYKIGKGARIGFSIVLVDRLVMAENSRIGHFNLFKGPFSLILDENAIITHFGTWSRGRKGVSIGESKFQLGARSVITTRHKFDLTKSIVVGEDSVIGGNGSQFWTHSYVHRVRPMPRYRIDGGVTIDDNCYIGSRVIVLPGVQIGSDVTVGAGTVVSKNVDQGVTCVGQPARSISRTVDPLHNSKLKLSSSDYDEDEVYEIVR